jgi:hypothetical protein
MARRREARKDRRTMNYYEALQRQTDKRWDYTQRRDGQTRAVGYCAGNGAAPHHEDGHETADEARECYKRFILDKLVKLEFGTTEDTQHRCEVEGCEGWTQKVSMVNHRTYNLCDDHRNVEALEGLVVVGSSMSSY